MIHNLEKSSIFDISQCQKETKHLKQKALPEHARVYMSSDVSSMQLNRKGAKKLVNIFLI